MGGFNGEANLIPRETYFNELCLNGSQWDYPVLQHFANSYKILKQNDFSVCRISKSDYQHLLEKLNNADNKSSKATNFFFSFFKAPYETSLINESHEESFVNGGFSFDGIPTPVGLSWTAVLNGVAFSILSDNSWDAAFINLDSVHGPVLIKHISRAEHLDAWIEQFKPLQLIETPINPEQKKFKVRQDHGNDVLEAFWKRIRKSPYITECVNSLEWRPYCRKFATPRENNSVDVVLIWDERGIGLNLMTTGRNFQETAKIAEILNQEYGVI